MFASDAEGWGGKIVSTKRSPSISSVELGWSRDDPADDPPEASREPDFLRILPLTLLVLVTSGLRPLPVIFEGKIITAHGHQGFSRF